MTEKKILELVSEYNKIKPYRNLVPNYVFEALLGVKK